MTIYKTNYDSHIITVTDKGRIHDYEGYALCPKKVQKLIDAGKYTKVDYFAHEFIAYRL